MELNKFLEKFLPEYEQRKNGIEELHRDEDDFSMADANVVATVVATEYFSEALQNFADRICEKQRDICVMNWKLATELIKTRQPKIEEL